MLKSSCNELQRELLGPRPPASFPARLIRRLRSATARSVPGACKWRMSLREIFLLRYVRLTVFQKDLNARSGYFSILFRRELTVLGLRMLGNQGPEIIERGFRVLTLSRVDLKVTTFLHPLVQFGVRRRRLMPEVAHPPPLCLPSFLEAAGACPWCSEGGVIPDGVSSSCEIVCVCSGNSVVRTTYLFEWSHESLEDPRPSHPRTRG